MAQLNSLIGAILRDFTEAQNAANQHSVALLQEYGANELLRSFSVPNACIDDMELELKYAFADPVDEQQREVDPQRLQQQAEDVAAQLAQTAITTVVYFVQRSDALGSDDYASFMMLEEKLKSEFCDFLTAQLKQALIKNASRIVSEQGKADAEVMQRVVMDCLREEFLEHEEFEIFTNNSDLKEHAQKAMGNIVGNLLRKLADDFDVLKTSNQQRFDVLVTAKELAKVPPEQLHSAKFRVKLRQCKISQTEENGAISDKLVVN